MTSWIVRSVFTVVFIFLGLAASLFAKDIISFDNKFSFWFWLVTVITTLLFFYSQKIASDYRKQQETTLKKTIDKNQQQQNKLLKGNEKLENLIRTLPPDDFLYRYSNAYNDSYEAYQICKAYNDKQVSEAFIRTLLLTIAALCRNFERVRGNRHRYAANIMIYHTYKDWSKNYKKDKKDISFFDENISEASLEGILQLIPELSVSTKSASKKLGNVENPTPDDHVLEIALPIPKKLEDKKGKLKALLGAPLSFKTKNTVHYEDTKGLKTWFDEDASFDSTIEDNVLSYFKSKEGRPIRGFISIPIFETNIFTENKSPIAILNIHKSSTFFKEHNPNDLLSLLQPFFNLLSDHIQHWKALKS